MNWMTALSLTGAALLVAVLGWRMRRLLSELAELRERLDRQEERTTGLQAELGALCKASMGAGERLVQLTNQIRRLDERQERTELQTLSDRSFERAIQLVQEGGTIEELMEQCGLTRGEAELLVTVHGVNAA